ncbi:high mobility group protein B2b [Oncorhynchus masou masou]|uniref:high mobility group protein B2b n=1 Tax=Oncorhynchus masou masou TaxID=90313 RepID=UPI003183CB33
MVKGDVNKPKGKTSAYAFFVQTCREEHKRKHPEQSVNFAEFSKQCSERWRGLTAIDKRRFEDMAKNDKVRYERDMRGYVPPKGMAKSGRRKKDPNAPKRPPSAFFVFSAEFRPTVKQEFPGCSIGETAKKLGIMWGQQTPTQKQPFEEKALRLREKYDKDMAAYRSGANVKRAPMRPGPGGSSGIMPHAAAGGGDDDDDDDDDLEDDDDEEDDDDDE